MAEEETHHPHMTRGESTEHKESKSAMYWQLGIAAAGLVVAALFLFSGGSSKKQQQPGQPTTVNASQPFIPNPTDISIGTQEAPIFWPGLPTSGTPSKPKTHHTGDKKDKDKDTDKDKHGHTNKSNDKKGFGKSPTGASHGHAVSAHNTHNPKTVETKGHANG